MDEEETVDPRAKYCSVVLKCHVLTRPSASSSGNSHHIVVKRYLDCTVLLRGENPSVLD